MAEKKSNAKNVEKGNSTLATTSEKSTKTTTKKTESNIVSNKATAKTADKAAKPAASKTATEKAAKPTTAKSTSKAASKADEGKPTLDKSAAKTSNTKSAEKTSTKTSSRNDGNGVSAKAASKATTKAGIPTDAEQKNATSQKNSTQSKSKQDNAGKEVAVTKSPSKTAKKESAVKVEDTVANKKVSSVPKDSTKKASTEKSANKNADSAQTATAVYGKSMATSRDKNKKAEVAVASESASSVPKVSTKKTSTAKSVKNEADSSKSDRMVASKAVKNDKKAKFDVKTFAKDSAVAVKNIFTNKKTRVFGIVAVAALIVFILILGISVGTATNNASSLSADSRGSSVKDYSLGKGSKYDYEYRTTAVAGYQEEYLEYNEPRKIPTEAEIKTEHIVTNPKMYPTYGHTPTGITEVDRRQLIDEAWKITSISTRIGSDGYTKNTYDRMDENGNLYIKNSSNQIVPGSPSKLYKHESAVGMYYGDDEEINKEKPISKRMTFNPRSFHYHSMYNVTGIYAPAGEVLKVEISDEDMDATGGIVIHIGQALYNNKANNIWLAKGQMQRFPIILNTLLITKDTASHDEENHKWVGYVGSFLGGPVYVGTKSKTFTTTISGGIRYSHFILGHTTPEDFEENKKSAAPYFDLEVWDNGVLHSGPRSCASTENNFTYDYFFKAAELWDKVTSVTTYGNNQNIVFLYDTFVAAGAAVAFPGQYAVNCPAGWMSGSLNYEALIKGGSWGNFHEYHHNFQGYGVGNGGEVTNNALTLVSYALFTKISANRKIDSYGAAGLGGWNSYTSATFALEEVKAISDASRSPSNGNQGLALYATLLHNFGAEAFMEVRKMGGGQSYLNYFNKWEQYTHQNMTYYFKDLLKANDFNGNIAESSYPAATMFVPISSVYQTGRSWSYDDETKYIKTMQPYVIPYGEKFTIDLSKYENYGNDEPNVDLRGKYKCGSIVLPEGFSYKVLNVSQPKNGSIVKNSDYIYTYTPGADMNSGDIYVTLQVKKDDGAFEVGNIDLILGFEQSHEINGRMLERTTYEFEGETTYTSALDAWNNSFKGATNTILGDNKNKSQNSNTDIWLTAEERASLSGKNAILEVKGKIYIDESTKYRFILRGRGDVALYLSLDNGATYEYAAHYNTGASPNWPLSGGNPINEDVYKDVDLKLNTWVYFKMVLVVNSHNSSFMGLGMGKVPMPRPAIDNETGEPLYEDLIDGSGNPVLDSDGNPIKVPKPDIQDPTPISYASAYRQSYQFPEKNFSPEYFFSKTYSWSYQSEKQIETKQTIVGTPKYLPWDNTATHKIENLFDDDDNTFIHTNRTAVSEANPFEITVKLDKPITANTLTFYGSNVKSQYRSYLPRNLKVWISEDGNDWTLVAKVVNSTISGLTIPVTFDQTYTFSYYRTEVTDTHVQTKYLALNKIELSNVVKFAGGSRTAVGDKKVKLYGTWNIKNTDSKFGRVYIGKANSSMEFEFTGKMLILFSSYNFGTNYEVYIDGKKINSIDFVANTDTCRESYLSSQLLNKKHTATIKCLGEANIESIVVVK